MDIYIIIEEEGDKEYIGLDNEDIAVWLYRGIIVAGVKCLEIIRQFSI